MATITLSPLISDLRGRIGSIVFCKWKGVHYVRRYAPHNPSNTLLQAAQRAVFRDAITAWQGLSDDARRRWSQKAAHLAMSGYNLFISRVMTGTVDNEYADECTPSQDSFASGSYLLRFSSALRPLTPAGRFGHPLYHYPITRTTA
ncbi:MAG: hypothetical protein HZC28_02315 [Spirochaetes bacterium]|nr:hypothetical protein [Spirochaetota bacterium]